MRKALSEMDIEFCLKHNLLFLSGFTGRGMTIGTKSFHMGTHSIRQTLQSVIKWGCRVEAGTLAKYLNTSRY